MITGLEIASIVVGCVNAGLGAAKLVSDWYGRRQERKKEPKNRQLEESLRSDASSIRSAYQYHLEQIRKNDKRRFEIGDDASHSEIGPSGHRLRAALRELRTKIKSTKSKVVPDLARFISTSNSAQLAIVEALARLHRRIIYETRIPRSLNPLRLFGFGKKKLQKKPPSSIPLGRIEDAQTTAMGSRAGSAVRRNVASSRTASMSTPTLVVGDSTAGFAAAKSVTNLPWEIETPNLGTHIEGNVGSGHSSQQCTCTRQVIYVDSMYVNSNHNNTTNTKTTTNTNVNRARRPSKSKSKPKEMEIVLVRRPVRS